MNPFNPSIQELISSTNKIIRINRCLILNKRHKEWLPFTALIVCFKEPGLSMLIEDAVVSAFLTPFAPCKLRLALLPPKKPLLISLPVSLCYHGGHADQDVAPCLSPTLLHHTLRYTILFIDILCWALLDTTLVRRTDGTGMWGMSAYMTGLCRSSLSQIGKVCICVSADLFDSYWFINYLHL